MEDLKRKYDEMARLMADGGGGDKSTALELMESTNMPFTNQVMSYPLPYKFKMPRIVKYDGNEDSAEHMESLCEHFILHGTPNEISCRAFPLTLARVAKDWFARLPAKSVYNFKTLGCLFLG